MLTQHGLACRMWFLDQHTERGNGRVASFVGHDLKPEVSSQPRHRVPGFFADGQRSVLGRQLCLVVFVPWRYVRPSILSKAVCFFSGVPACRCAQADPAGMFSASAFLKKALLVQTALNESRRATPANTAHLFRLRCVCLLPAGLYASQQNLHVSKGARAERDARDGHPG